MNRFYIQFDFTTVHSGGRFVGRSGHFTIETTDKSLELEAAHDICVQFVRSEKPKWNIFMLDVKSVKKV